ncbi:hypothetical protein V6N11_080007 [Hibiscus sabdariffa]|uniref:Uncharacterized protein n=1 Tax=Hibiscus sabdariffa TaxID=183260 RepID=A0ABR2RXJ4_9ROSI
MQLKNTQPVGFALSYITKTSIWNFLHFPVLRILVDLTLPSILVPEKERSLLLWILAELLPINNLLCLRWKYEVTIAAAEWEADYQQCQKAEKGMLLKAERPDWCALMDQGNACYLPVALASVETTVQHFLACTKAVVESNNRR